MRYLFDLAKSQKKIIVISWAWIANQIPILMSPLPDGSAGDLVGALPGKAVFFRISLETGGHYTRMFVNLSTCAVPTKNCKEPYRRCLSKYLTYPR